MTDKELKKLSRLELLELLLRETKENERLKKEINELTEEREAEKSARYLSEAVRQVDESLKKAKAITDNLSGISRSKPIKDISPDANIYTRLIAFLVNNKDVMALLPENLSSDILNRINEVISPEKKFK